MIVTIAWAVTIPNAVNLLDGLDGLAAGMVAIAATFFFAYVVLNPGELGPASQAALLSAITAGICVGFLPWNFHPAKIFMGDAGSMFLGMLLAIATIEGIGKNLTEPSGGDIAATAGALAVPFLVLLIPAIDVVLAIVRRTRRGQGIGHADKEHLHHRLMELGHGHRQAVLLMYLWSALVSAGALAVGLIDGRLLRRHARRRADPDRRRRAPRDHLPASSRRTPGQRQRLGLGLGRCSSGQREGVMNAPRTGREPPLAPFRITAYGKVPIEGCSKRALPGDNRRRFVGTWPAAGCQQRGFAT